MHENSGPLQALTWHSLREQSWGPCWPPSVFKSKNSLGRVLTGCSFLRWAMRGLLHAPPLSEALILSLAVPCPHPLCPASECYVAGRHTPVLCALCSWNRIWTRFSSIWKKRGSSTCLASVKRQERGSASCATTPREPPVRAALPPPAAQNRMCPWGCQGCRSPTTLVGFLLAYIS